MANVLVHLDDEMSRRLKQVAPSRQRSRFIRLAIQRALMALDEIDTRAAYARSPLDDPRGWFDPSTWSPESWKDVAPRSSRTRKAR